MALFKCPTGVGTGGGMQHDSGSTSLSTSQNTRVDLSFTPKIIRYNTKGASGSQASYFLDVTYIADNKFYFNNLQKEVLYSYYGSASSAVGDVGENTTNNRGSLMVVDSTGFTVGLCDTTGYGQSLNWEAWG